MPSSLAPMIDDVRAAGAGAAARLAAAPTLDDLTALATELLGKKGVLAAFKSRLGGLAPEDRRTVGQALNEATAEAQRALNTAATRYPNSRWTSWMRNLQGRAYLDDDKPATAARIFLDNYQNNPRGERAADSLYFLGQALTRLNRRPEACRVYDELAQVYPNMRDYIRTRLPQARTDARCGAAGGNAR